jgi:DNA-binding transcriptional LysR family regulator
VVSPVAAIFVAPANTDRPLAAAFRTLNDAPVNYTIAFFASNRCTRHMTIGVISVERAHATACNTGVATRRDLRYLAVSDLAAALPERHFFRSARPLHEISIRRLNHIVALAEEGSFARAAERVHLSQPALSRSVQAIEGELGMRLFDRATRGVAVTQAGKLIIERARRVLFETGCLVRDVELLKTHEAGEVRIGLGPYPAALLLPDLLTAFAGSYPNVQMKAELNHAHVMIDMLLKEQLDFLVLDRRVLPDDASLSIRRLPRHYGHWFARPGHPLLQRGGPVPSSALREYPIVTVPLPQYMNNAMRRLLKIRSHERIPIQLECNDVRVLKGYVETSNALLFATASVTRRELEMNTLAAVPLTDGLRSGLEFALVSLAERTMSPAGEVALALTERMLSEANANQNREERT